jgi:hypothetical protein
MGYVLGGMDIRGITGMWVQHVAGAARQAATMGKNYKITEADVDNAWSSAYSGFMNDLKLFIDKTGEANPQARGVGKILLAYSIGTVSDLWGDVPYSEAFQGNNALKPKYDTQESIYGVVATLLTEAIADLSTANADNAIPLSSASNDIIYNGNKSKWIAAAHSLRARFALHLSNVATVDYSAVLADCAAGIADNASDFAVPFGADESNANPIYQFDVQRTDVAPSDDFAAFAAGDPRLAVFTDGNFGSYYGSIDSPVPFMTFVETKFIEAEAQLRKSSPSQADANIAYDEAVSASLDKFDVTDDTWLTDNTTGVLGDRTIQNVIEAKYIALFMQVEAYNDFRRTGYPDLSPTAGSAVPSRYPYATSERLYNADNVPTGITLDSPVWWMGAK